MEFIHHHVSQHIHNSQKYRSWCQIIGMRLGYDGDQFNWKLNVKFNSTLNRNQFWNNLSMTLEGKKLISNTSHRITNTTKPNKRKQSTVQWTWNRKINEIKPSAIGLNLKNKVNDSNVFTGQSVRYQKTSK